MIYKTANFIPLEPNDYPSIITEISEGVWPSGDPYFEIVFSIEHPETLSTIRVPQRVSPLLGKGDKFRLFNDLIALLKKDVAEEGEFDPHELTGIEVIATTILEPDKRDPEKQWVRITGVKKNK